MTRAFAILAVATALAYLWRRNRQLRTLDEWRLPDEYPAILPR